MQFAETILAVTEEIILVKNSNSWLKKIFSNNFDIDVDREMGR